MRANYKGISINTSKNTHEVIFSLINKDPNISIADIPSGSGAFIQRLKDNAYKNIIAIDIKNILEIEHNSFIEGNMNEVLPISDGSIDTAVCIDGIEHISRQFDFISEISRILKEKGEFIVSTPNISSIKSRWKWLFSGHHHKCNHPLDENNPTPLHHIAMISFPEIRYLLHTNGLQITKVTTNRIKPANWFFALLVPFVYLYTSIVYFKSGKRENTSKMNQEIKKIMLSKTILFGETLIVKAIKIKN